MGASNRTPAWTAAALVVMTSLAGGVVHAAESADVPATPTGPVEPAGPAQMPQQPEEAPAVVVPLDAPSLQLSADFVTPALAFGGYFPEPDIAGGRIKVGPVNVAARLNMSIGYDDNIRVSSTDKRGSLFTTIAPSVMLGLERPEQRYYVLYRGSYSTYFSESANNNQIHNLALQAVDEWTVRLRTDLRYDFIRGYDPRGSTGTASGKTQTWNTNMVRGTAIYGAPGARGRVEGTVRYIDRTYVTNRAATAALDHQQWEVGGFLSVRVAPKTYTTLRVTHAEITHPDDPRSDSSENRYLLGAIWEATAATRASGAVGYMTKDPKSSAVPSFSGPTYEAAVNWSPLTYSNVNFLARRTFAEAAEAGSRFLVVDFISANWVHSWFDRFRSSLTALYGRQQHEGIDRTDNYYTLDARVSYALRPRLRLGAQLRHDVRTSPNPSLDYKRNLTLITLETSL